MKRVAAAAAVAAARNDIVGKPLHELALARRRAAEAADDDANSRAQRPRSPSPPAPVPHSSTSSLRLSPHGASSFRIEGDYPVPEAAQRIDAARRAAASVGRGGMISQLALPVWPSKPSVKGGRKFGKPEAGFLAPKRMDSSSTPLPSGRVCR